MRICAVATSFILPSAYIDDDDDDGKIEWEAKKNNLNNIFPEINACIITL